MKLLRRLLKASRRGLDDRTITATQVECLRMIGEHQPIPTGLLAKRVQVTPSTIVRLLDRLQARGLIARKRDEEDRRVVRLLLTETGASIIRKFTVPNRLARALMDIPADQLASIVEALEVVASKLEDAPKAREVADTLPTHDASSDCNRLNPAKSKHPSAPLGNPRLTRTSP